MQGVTATGHPAPADGHGAGGEAVFDLTHLDSQTLGDDELKRDVLELFLLQCSKLLPVIAADSAADGMRGRRLDAAHTLKGAASAVGAWTVAARAGAVEQAVGAVFGDKAVGAACGDMAVGAACGGGAREAVAALAAAIAEARLAIERMLAEMPAREAAQSAA